MSKEGALKNCALCYEYNSKAVSSDKEGLILGFYRLRDEATNKALEHLDGYIADCLKEEREICEPMKDMDILSQKHIRYEEYERRARDLSFFAETLSTLCKECNSSSPRIVEAVREHERQKEY